MPRRWNRTLTLSLAAIAGLALASPALAQEGTDLDVAAQLTEHKVLLDTLWVMVAAFLVFFMQAGFSYVEGGLTRAKNCNNIMMKNMMDFSLATLGFWIFGFAIMFGDGNGLFGHSGWFLGGADNSPIMDGEGYEGVYGSISWAGVPLAAKFVFQLVFAGTAATIVSGAMAERTKFHSYLIYSFLISAFVYPVIGHWIWGGGWLADLGMWDFAGSTVVHSTGGWLALMGALVLGPRIGKYAKDGKTRAIPGHSMPMAALGVFILWLGWFGFNPGSTMAADVSIAHIAMTTNIAAAMGAIGSMSLSWMVYKKADISMTLNGVLAGLVAITAPCAFVSASSAAIIGLLGGLLVVGAIVFFDKIRIDDPVGAIAVHGVCGALGTICVGLFAQDVIAPGKTGDGLLFGGGASLLIAQLIGVVSVFGWCVVAGAILFCGIRFTLGLRVSAEEELAGLDIGEHGSEAYPDFSMAVKASVPYDEFPNAAKKASPKPAVATPAASPAPAPAREHAQV
ncbi:ammonium transporter [soil metagenome]